MWRASTYSGEHNWPPSRLANYDILGNGWQLTTNASDLSGVLLRLGYLKIETLLSTTKMIIQGYLQKRPMTPARTSNHVWQESQGLAHLKEQMIRLCVLQSHQLLLQEMLKVKISKELIENT